MGIRIKDKDINFKRNLRIYLSFVKKHRWAAFFLMFLVLLIELVRTVDKFLFKVIIDRGTEFIGGTLLRPELVTILLIVAAVYISSQLVRLLLKYFQIHIMNRFFMNLMTDLKRAYYNHIIHLSHKFHTEHKTGGLISKLTRGSGAMERLSDVFIFDVFPLFFQLIIVIVSLIYFDIRSAFIVILMSVLFIGYSIKIQNKQKPSNIDRTVKEDFEKAYLGDTMTNIDSIKYFGKEQLIKNRFRTYTERTKKAYVKFWDYFKLMDIGQSFIIGIGLFLIILFPLLKFLDGEMSLGSITFIYNLYMGLIYFLYSFVHGIRGYYRSMADLNPLFDYGEIENDIRDKPYAETLHIRKGEIEFKNLDFKYHKHKLFDNFNLKIDKNQKVALVGHSGCGKTTLVKLLYRFYDPEKGQILLDGKDIREFKQESIREELSIVPQEAVLFDDTIYNNIAFSNPGAAKKQVMEAMRFARIDEIVETFPNKENTIVGERGVKLSGGEKQRVSIARAILADKKVLVLDEATSSLDSQTEYEIQRELKELMKGRTSLIIAHRLSTIMHADKIIVMDKGKIVQTGKHNELINKPGQYRKLWNLQRGGYIK